eukprot:4071435-Pleurochrysis_carterae.AAC.1
MGGVRGWGCESKESSKRVCAKAACTIPTPSPLRSLRSDPQICSFLPVSTKALSHSPSTAFTHNCGASQVSAHVPCGRMYPRLDVHMRRMSPTRSVGGREEDDRKKWGERLRSNGRAAHMRLRRFWRVGGQSKLVPVVTECITYSVRSEGEGS